MTYYPGTKKGTRAAPGLPPGVTWPVPQAAPGSRKVIPGVSLQVCTWSDTTPGWSYLLRGTASWSCQAEPVTCWSGLARDRDRLDGSNILVLVGSCPSCQVVVRCMSTSCLRPVQPAREMGRLVLSLV